jgi:hypothetical protein
MAANPISLARTMGAIASLSPRLWLDAGRSFASQVATGRTADTLQDFSMNKNHFRQMVPSKRPLIVPSGKNSNAVLRFDGADDFMQCINNADAFKFMTTGPATSFIVHKPWNLADPNDTRYLLDCISLAGSVGGRSGFYFRMDDRTAQTQNDNLFVVISSQNSGGAISIIGTGASNGVSPSNQWSINMIRTDPGHVTPANRLYLSRNGGSELQGNTQNVALGVNGPAYPLALGACGGDGLSPYIGDVGAVVLFQGLLSQSNISAVLAELNSTWGIY